MAERIAYEVTYYHTVAWRPVGKGATYREVKELVTETIEGTNATSLGATQDGEKVDFIIFDGNQTVFQISWDDLRRLKKLVTSKPKVVPIR